MKTTRMIQILVASLVVSLSSMAHAHAGGADIGGGDTIRAYFLNVGDAVISYLTTNPDGQKLVAAQALNIENLQKSLDIKVIKVVDEALIDRTGSLVDALGTPGSITLNKLNWAQHIEHESDVYFLVFHEMLRENGINDDNFVISKALIKFPEELKIKKSLISKKPLLAEDSLKEIIDPAQIDFGGTGCPLDSVKTFTRFDAATNQFEIYPNEMAPVVGANNRKFDRGACSLAIPYKAKAGKKIIITQVDINGDVDLEKQKTVQITADTFTVGGKVASQAKNINSGNSALSAGFLLRENLTAETTCGGEGILRLNSSVLIQDQAKETTSVVSYAKVSRIALSLKSVDCTAPTQK